MHASQKSAMKSSIRSWIILLLNSICQDDKIGFRTIQEAIVVINSIPNYLSCHKNIIEFSLAFIYIEYVCNSTALSQLETSWYYLSWMWSSYLRPFSFDGLARTMAYPMFKMCWLPRQTGGRVNLLYQGRTCVLSYRLLQVKAYFISPLYKIHTQGWRQEFPNTGTGG